MRETDEGTRRDRTRDRVDARETASEGWRIRSRLCKVFRQFSVVLLSSLLRTRLSSLGSPLVSRCGATYDLQFNTVRARMKSAGRVLQLVYTVRIIRRNAPLTELLVGTREMPYNE